VPLLQPRPLLFRPDASGAEIPPHLRGAAVAMPPGSARSLSTAGRDVPSTIAPSAAMPGAMMPAGPMPNGVMPPATGNASARSHHGHGAGTETIGQNAPVRDRSPDASGARRDSGSTGQSGATLAPLPRSPALAEPAPMMTPMPGSPLPRHRIADAPDGLRIGTLEVRVAAPRTAPQPHARPAQGGPAQPRPSPLASTPTRIARPFATFGFNQS
jgi:hypothetical protein